MEFVQAKLRQFDNISVVGFEDNYKSKSYKKLGSDNGLAEAMQTQFFNKLLTESGSTLGPAKSTIQPEEEFKSVGASCVTIKASAHIQLLKDTIRHLPMFESHHLNSDEYDFEWPTKAHLKALTYAKQLRLKEIRYQQDAFGRITAIKIVCHDFASPFFAANLDNKKQVPIILNAQSFYDNKDGHYRINNIAARIETNFNSMISNIYLNEDKNGIQRIGTKRGNGPLSHIQLEAGEEIIGVYGNYSDVQDRSVISGLGFIVWRPN